MATERAAPAVGAEQPFLTDVQTLRARARTHIEEGAVTETYALDSELVVRILNAMALAKASSR